MWRWTDDILWVVTHALFLLTIVQITRGAGNPCPSKVTCSECIQTESCAWCMESDFGNGLRCFAPQTQGNVCNEPSTWFPVNEQVTVANVNASQISPQRISLKLRINQSHVLYFKYTHIEDAAAFPLVEIKDSATSHIGISYYSSCLTKTPARLTNKCDGLKVGDEVTFNAHILATSCPEDPKEWFLTFSIYPVGINARLAVDLEVICDCPCEKRGHNLYEVASSKCHEHGTYKCGVCECDPPYFGRTCECSMLGSVDNSGDFECKPHSSSPVECSGRGQCICGLCECEMRMNPEEIINGKYCECDNFSCDRHNGRVCSGPESGECICGSCACKPGWEGPACECSSSINTCISPVSNEICSGHGECVCGQCKCHNTDLSRYSGRYCQRCPTCPGLCSDFKECVQCRQYRTGPYMEDGLCQENCMGLNLTSTEMLRKNEDNDVYICAFYDEDDCRFEFAYKHNEDETIEIFATRTRDCPYII